MINITLIIILLILILLIYSSCSNRENLEVVTLDNYEPILTTEDCYKNGVITSYSNYYNMISSLLASLGKKTNYKNNQLKEVNTRLVDEYVIKNLLEAKINEVVINNDKIQSGGSLNVIDIILQFYEDADKNLFVKALFNLYDTAKLASNEAYALISLSDSELKIENAGLVNSDVEEDATGILPFNSVSNNIGDSVNTITVEGGLPDEIISYLDSNISPS